MLASARRFVRWLSGKCVGVVGSLFDSIPGFDPTNDRLHARWELSYEELELLLDAAKGSSKVVCDVAGIDRYHLYLTAAYIGLRASELAVLTPAHFNLDVDYPTVILPGKKPRIVN
jgi:integrase/recombinase XerD